MEFCNCFILYVAFLLKILHEVVEFLLFWCLVRWAWLCLLIFFCVLTSKYQALLLRTQLLTQYHLSKSSWDHIQLIIRFLQQFRTFLIELLFVLGAVLYFVPWVTNFKLWTVDYLGNYTLKLTVPMNLLIILNLPLDSSAICIKDWIS